MGKKDDNQITEQQLKELLSYVRKMYSDSEIAGLFNITEYRVKKIRKKFDEDGLWGIESKNKLESKVREMAIDGKTPKEISEELDINLNFVKMFYLKLQKLKIIKPIDEMIESSSVGYNFQNRREKQSQDSTQEENNANHKKDEANANKEITINSEIKENLNILFSEPYDVENQRKEYVKEYLELDSEVKIILIALKLHGKLNMEDEKVLREKVKSKNINKTTFKEIIKTLAKFKYLEQVEDFIKIKENDDNFFTKIEKKKYNLFKDEVKRIELCKKIIELLKSGDFNKSEIAEKLGIDEIIVSNVARRYGVKGYKNYENEI